MFLFAAVKLSTHWHICRKKLVKKRRFVNSETWPKACPSNCPSSGQGECRWFTQGESRAREQEESTRGTRCWEVQGFVCQSQNHRSYNPVNLHSLYLFTQQGNYVHESVPVSNTEDDNRVERTWTPEGVTVEKKECLSHHEVLYRYVKLVS